MESFILQPFISFGVMASVLGAVWLFARHQLQVQKKEALVRACRRA